MVRIAAAILAGFLIAGLSLTGCTAAGVPAATQAAETKAPVAAETVMRIRVTMRDGSGELAVTLNAAPVELGKLAAALRQIMRDADDRGRLIGNIQVPPKLPYQYLTEILVALAQADVQQYRLSTDGKGFVDEVMPAIERLDLSAARTSSTDLPALRTNIKMLRKDGETWVAAFGRPATMLGQDGDVERTAIADQISSMGKHSVTVVIQPNGDVPCGDVVVICKDCAKAGIKNVAFSPAGDIVTTRPIVDPAGATGRGKKIVYIIDASASVTDSFSELQQEVVHAINNMIPAQKFDVVMLSDRPTAIFAKIERAAPSSKRDAAKQLVGVNAKGIIEGKLAPFQDAFEKAFALQPDILYFVSGSTFDPQLLKVVAQLNKDHKVQINAIVFMRKDKTLEEQMMQLATSSHGLYKFVSPADVEPAMRPAK